jgi:hypothetical protein
MDKWDPFAENDRRQSLWLEDVKVTVGDRVRLRPRGRADIIDIALAGRIGTVEAIEEDFEGRLYLAITVEDDPGKDLGSQRQVGHRFFFRPDEVVPLAESNE